MGSFSYKGNGCCHLHVVETTHCSTCSAAKFSCTIWISQVVVLFKLCTRQDKLAVVSYSYFLFPCFVQLFVSAMGPPGGGRNDISDRFTRHTNIISIDSFDDNTMTKIFTSIVDWHFAKGFDASFGRLGKVRFVIIACW